MKRGHIIAIIIIAIGIFALFNAFGDMSRYSTFEDSEKTPDELVKVVGVLSKDKPVVYNPEEDPNLFSFHMKDAENNERRVVMNAAKPQDFNKSEKIVLTGKMVGENFVATDMLLKCPSKYKDEEIFVRSEL